MLLASAQMGASVSHMDIPTKTQRTAQLVAAAIEAANESKQSIAKATGIPRVTLDRRLDGHAPFTVKELYAIAVALDVPVESFVVTAKAVA